MSRTKRCYNKPNSPIYEWKHDLGWVPYWHPWKVLWHHTGCLYEPPRSKRRREWCKIEIKRELLNLCPDYSIVGKNECFTCSMLWYPFDCEYVIEIPFYNYKEHTW